MLAAAPSASSRRKVADDPIAAGRITAERQLVSVFGVVGDAHQPVAKNLAGAHVREVLKRLPRLQVLAVTNERFDLFQGHSQAVEALARLFHGTATFCCDVASDHRTITTKRLGQPSITRASVATLSTFASGSSSHSGSFSTALTSSKDELRSSWFGEPNHFATERACACPTLLSAAKVILRRKLAKPRLSVAPGVAPNRWRGVIPQV